MSSFSTLKGQVSDPPGFVPAAENTRLIDSLIKVTNYKAFFMKYCSDRVDDYANANNWSRSQKENILKSISFNNVSGMIHNGFGGYSTDDLKKLLDVITLINKKSTDWNKLSLVNYMVARNIDIYIDNIINGKFLKDK